MFTAQAPYLVIGAHVSNGSISAAVTVTAPARANGVLLQAITQNVRYRLDNVNPSTSVGFRLIQGQAPTFVPITEGQPLKFIEEAATAVLQYQFVRT